MNILHPVPARVHIIVGSYLHTVATVECRLDGIQPTVDSCILRMDANIAVYFEGKIKSRRAARQFESTTLRCKHGDVIIIKRRHHSFHKTDIMIVVSNVQQILTEPFYPSADITLLSFRHTTILRIAAHTFRTDVHFFPVAILGQKLNMQTLIPALFWGVNIIEHTSWLFLEHIGQQGINAQSHLLFRQCLHVPIDDSHEMPVFQMIEIASFSMHLTADAERCTICRFHTKLNIVLVKLCDNLSHEPVQPSFILFFVLFEQLFYMRILQRTTVSETQVFQFYLDGIQPQTIGQRRIEEVRLTCYFHLFVCSHAAQRAHIMQAVGQFNQYSAYIILHRTEHLFEIIHLL